MQSKFLRTATHGACMRNIDDSKQAPFKCGKKSNLYLSLPFLFTFFLNQHTKHVCVFCCCFDLNMKPTTSYDISIQSANSLLAKRIYRYSSYVFDVISRVYFGHEVIRIMFPEKYDILLTDFIFFPHFSFTFLGSAFG